MMLIKCRFLKDGWPYGREYTYRSAEDVAVGDHVQVNPMAKGFVTAVNVPEEEVAVFADKIKTIRMLKVENKNNQMEILVNGSAAEIAYEAEELLRAIRINVGRTLGEKVTTTLLDTVYENSKLSRDASGEKMAKEILDELFGNIDSLRSVMKGDK